MKRWIQAAALALAAAAAFVALRERAERPAPESEEIDEASKQALREILRQEEE